MKTYAIGDMHGRFDLFAKAVWAIQSHSPTGRVIILGDFVDRGPSSRAIIETLMAGPQAPGWTWEVLQGNHEAMMVGCLANPSLLDWWIRNGGGMTLQSYGYKNGDKLLPLKVPVEHLEWLASLPVYIEDEHRIYVHAGCPYDTPIAECETERLQWMLYRDGGKEYSDADYADDLKHVSGKHIVHGHHQSATHPLLLPHRTNLDGFAWHEGVLPIGVFDDDVPGGPVEILKVTG